MPGPRHNTPDGSHLSIARFAIRFVGLLLFFFVVFLYFEPIGPFLIALNEVTAATSAAFARLLGMSVVADGSIVQTPNGMSLAVRQGCNGIFVAMIYFAALMAFPATLRERFVGAALGLSAIGVLNIVRMTTLCWTAWRIPRAFEYVHIQLWQTLFVILVVGIWLVWARMSLASRRGASVEASR